MNLEGRDQRILGGPVRMRHHRDPPCDGSTHLSVVPEDDFAALRDRNTGRGAGMRVGGRAERDSPGLGGATQ